MPEIQMQHPAPDNTEVQVQVQYDNENVRLITGTVQNSQQSNGSGNGWYYDIVSSGWGDGNNSVSVVMTGVFESVVILPMIREDE